MSSANIRRSIPQILGLLMEERFTIAELSDRLGIRYDTVREFINELHEAKVIFVIAWRRKVKRAKPSAVWALGRSLDAPYPVAKTGTQRTHDWRTKRKEAPLNPVPTAVNAPSSVFDLGRHLGASTC